MTTQLCDWARDTAIMTAKRTSKVRSATAHMVRLCTAVHCAVHRNSKAPAPRCTLFLMHLHLHLSQVHSDSNAPAPTHLSGLYAPCAPGCGRSAPTCWAYVFCHYNYLYPCLQSTLQEIAEAYQKLHGREAHESDSI